MSLDATTAAILIPAIGAALQGGDLTNLVGLVLPPFVDLINIRVKNDKARLAVSVLVSLLVAAALNYKELIPFDINNVPEIMKDLGMIFTAAHTSYKLWWEKSANRQVMRNNYEKGVAVAKGETEHLDA